MALEPITRQEQIIAGKDLEPITRMEKFLKEYGGGGGAKHWNDIEGKPFGETVIEWDGNTEGYDVVQLNPAVSYVKVSDLCPTVEELIGKKVVVNANGQKNEMQISVDKLVTGTNGFTFSDCSLVVATGIEVNVGGGAMTVPSTGIYFPYMGGGVAYMESLELLQTIDPKYLPSGGGTFVVNIESADMQNWTADKTPDEIIEAVNNGNAIIANSIFVNDGFQQLTQYKFDSYNIDETTGKSTITFSAYNFLSTNLIGAVIMYSKNKDRSTTINFLNYNYVMTQA